MQQKFPLFQSHLDLAHHYWMILLKNGDWAVDATCGGGQDTLRLAKILEKAGGGGLIGLDIQEEAILRTQELLQRNLGSEIFKKIYIYKQSHVNFPELCTTVPIKLIVYNLGYLPKGNKQLTTQAKTTLESVEKALELLSPGGVMSLTCYPGHPEGAVEEKALLEMAKELPSSHWNVCYHSFPNRDAGPSLILIQKNSNRQIKKDGNLWQFNGTETKFLKTFLCFRGS